MTTKKRTLIISLIVLVVFLALFLILKTNKETPEILADWPYYPDVKSITEKADVIIIGDVVSAKSVKQIQERPNTISTVKVTYAIKGDVNIGDVISIRQLGDYKKQPESTLKRMNGYLSKNQECLMFLAKFDDLPYTPLNPNQGIVWIKDGTTLHSKCEYALFGYDNGENSEKINVSKAIEEISEYVDQ